MDNKQIKKIFNNMTTMGLFSGEYNSNPTKAEHHMECIQTLCKNVEGFLELPEKLWSIFDDKTLEERVKIITKQNLSPIIKGLINSNYFELNIVQSVKKNVDLIIILNLMLLIVI